MQQAACGNRATRAIKTAFSSHLAADTQGGMQKHEQHANTKKQPCVCLNVESDTFMIPSKPTCTRKSEQFKKLFNVVDGTCTMPKQIRPKGNPTHTMDVSTTPPTTKAQPNIARREMGSPRYQPARAVSAKASEFALTTVVESGRYASARAKNTEPH
eukprot:m.329663 g.329663  ORF g.329663 m.329663 type:complete len:157 (-) comp16039_c1_seq2:633-1103(-)